MTIISSKSFRSSISEADTAVVIAKQINNVIPDMVKISELELTPYVKNAFARLYNCFKAINNKYYSDGTYVIFNHLNSDHYCSLLYLVSNEAYKANAIDIATKLFLLNKYLHGLDLYFSVDLPEVYMFVHPVGTVIGGHTQYSNKIVFYQNCTVGGVFQNGNYIYPKFGENIVLYSRTSVVGECNIGNNIIFGANSFVIKSDIPSNSIVTGSYPHNVITQKPSVDIQFFY